jgi:hypothetical protein
MHVAIQVALAYVRPLIVHFFALAQAELDFDESVLEVDRKRDKGVTLLPDPTIYALDLLRMEEELLLSIWVVLENSRRKGVFRDMEIPDPHFPTLDFREGVGEGEFAVLDRFNLCA